jgi:hypothetical protein
MAAPTFVAAALHPGVRTAFVERDRLYAILQRLGAEWAGLDARRLAADHGVRVLFKRRNGRFQPADDSPLAEDDELLAVASHPLR